MSIRQNELFSIFSNLNAKEKKLNENRFTKINTHFVKNEAQLKINNGIASSIEPLFQSNDTPSGQIKSNKLTFINSYLSKKQASSKCFSTISKSQFVDFYSKFPNCSLKINKNNNNTKQTSEKQNNNMNNYSNSYILKTTNSVAIRGKRVNKFLYFVLTCIIKPH